MSFDSQEQEKPITVDALATMSQDALDELYQKSPVGEIPNGNSQGTVLIMPGSIVCGMLIPLIRSLVWQGKLVFRDQGFLLNKTTLFGLPLVDAQVYKGTSWLDGKEAIIIDYSHTSLIVARQIRDEVREVSPGIYLGQVYLVNTRVLNFVMEF